jgi:long-subunit fatty acid transport protein
MKRALVIVLLLVLAAASASANPLDVFGLGGRGPALAGALSTLADDASAAYYNPAGLALGDRPTFLAGYSFGIPRLTFDGRDAPEETARGVTLGLSLPRQISGTTAAFGIALYFPDQRVVRIHSTAATEPRFAQYDNRLQRIAIHPALAWRPRPWISIGAGVSILSDAKGSGTSFDLGLDLNRISDPSAQRATASIDVSLPTRVAPVAGIWLTPHPDWRIALTYRGSLSLDVSIDTHVAIDAGILKGQAITGFSASDYYSPAELTLGVAYNATRTVTLTAEATWYRWSQAPSPLPTAQAMIQIGIPIDVVQVSIPSAAYQPSDTVATRAGIEARLSPKPWLDVELRGGASFEPTPYPRQTGMTSLADNDKFVLAAGAGLVFRDLGEILRGPVRLDFYLQAHLLRERFHPKDDPLGPTPSFRSGGSLWASGFMLGVGF